MYVAGKDHALREPARRFLARVRSGAVKACTSTEVLHEILYRYVGLGRLDLAQQVYELFVEICPIIFPVTLADTDRAKELLASVAGSSVRDAVHAAVMLNNDVHEIASFDRGFDDFAGIKRLQLE
jgi:predicted nucleic acid-binding protein